MSVSLAKIQSFVAIAEEGQFRRAAEKLGLSQPTLSAHVRDLEERLGTALFNRTTRSVALTTEGERFLKRVRGVLGDLEDALSEVRDQAQLQQGRLVIAATPSVAANLLPAALAPFQSRYPRVRVQITEDQSSGVERRVETGEADFGVGPLPQRHGGFALSRLHRDRFVGVVGKDHPLAKRARVPLAQLVSYPLLTTTPQSSIRDSLNTVLEARGITLHTDHLLMQHQTVVAMVAAGLGVALLPSLALGQLDCSSVALLKVVPELTRDVGIIQRKGGSVSSAAREFLRLWASTRLPAIALDV